MPAALAAPGDLSLVSVGPAGLPGTAPAEASALAADGRLVAFTSAAPLTGVPTGGNRQVFVRDRVAGTTVLASASPAGEPANAAVDGQDVANPLFAISGDGRFVVFATAATNLAPDANGAQRDVFRKDLATGAVALVSTGPQGQANAAVGGDPDVSFDGTRVAFTTGQATNLIAGGDQNGATGDVVVRDLAAGTTVLAARSGAGQQAAGATERPAISADGRVVAFEAVVAADDLVPGDQNAANDVVVRDLAAGTTQAASAVGAGAGGGGMPDLSGDGRFVVFDTPDRLDPVADTNAVVDVYRRDLATGAAVLVSARAGTDAGADQGGQRGRISADGTRVAFRSTATTLTPADQNAGAQDVYVRTIPARQTIRASERADGGQGLNDADVPAVAADGGAVAFTYDDTPGRPLIPGADVNARPDAFLKEIPPTDAAGPAIALAGPAEGATGDAQVTVSGTAGDPAGVVGVQVNGRPVRIGAGGAFSTDVTIPVGASQVRVSARDGAGNTAVLTRSLTRVLAPGAAGPAAARALRPTARLSGRRVVVRFALTAPARVRAQVFSRTEQARPRRVVLRSTGRAVTRPLQPGVRQVVIPVPRLAPGRYQVRLGLTSAGGVSLTTAALRVPAAAARRR